MRARVGDQAIQVRVALRVSAAAVTEHLAATSPTAAEVSQAIRGELGSLAKTVKRAMWARFR